MANREVTSSSDAAVLTHALEKMRARDGLTLPRLQSRTEGAATILGIPMVRALSAAEGIEPSEAALLVVDQCIAESLDVTQRIVADAVLALGRLADSYRQHSVDERVILALSSDALGKRRAALLTNWRRLHEAVGVSPPAAPSDRTLRGTIEPDVLRQLARGLIEHELSSTPTSGRADGQPAVAGGDNPVSQLNSRVLVLGAAVIDAIFRTKVIPQHETSTPAHGFDLVPGGKGLSQALAAARLGLDVSLIAAVADDQFGREIVKHMHEGDVRTDLLKYVPNSRTPVTGVFELPLGDSIAAYWRNEQITLTVRDIDKLAHEISGCGILLATFETPGDTLDRALDFTQSGQQHKPMVIVTPGQPYTDNPIAKQSLARIDYLVAHTWELEKLAPITESRFDPDRVSGQLLDRGVKHVCLLGNGGGTVYSQVGNPRRLPTLTSHFKESSTTRDAFCAALAAKLIGGKSFTPSIAKWVTAAMACAAEDYSLKTTMPDRERIDRKLRQLKSQNRRWAE